MKCLAIARTNTSGAVVAIGNEHNHPRPRFYQKTTKKMIHLPWEIIILIVIVNIILNNF